MNRLLRKGTLFFACAASLITVAVGIGWTICSEPRKPGPDEVAHALGSVGIYRIGTVAESETDVGWGGGTTWIKVVGLQSQVESAEHSVFETLSSRKGIGTDTATAVACPPEFGPVPAWWCQRGTVVDVIRGQSTYWRGSVYFVRRTGEAFIIAQKFPTSVS